MIRFERVDEPEAFDAKARKPGNAWLKKNPSAKRPRDYWTRFKPDLADGFKNLCAYSAIYEAVGTVDHFVSYDEDPSQTYEWSNYRYASAWINSSKSNLEQSRLLDPFEVEDGWFRILLPSLQLVVDASNIPPELHERAQFVVTRLNLRDDERVMRNRREWYRLYQEGKLSLAGLAEKAPLIARAVEAEKKEKPDPSIP